MKIIGFEAADGPHLGVIDNERVIDLNAADPRLPRDLGEVLRQTGGDLSALADLAKRAPASSHRSLEAIKYALPVARPGKIICLGLNYLEHAKEGGHSKPGFPLDLHALPHLADSARGRDRAPKGLRNARL